jgi:hypothetical protein
VQTAHPQGRDRRRDRFRKRRIGNNTSNRGRLRYGLTQAKNDNLSRACASRTNALPTWMITRGSATLPSFTKGAGKDKVIGSFLADETVRRGIKIKPLSYSVAEFSAPTWQISWLRANYPVLLCSVNPKLVDSPEHLADLERMVILHAREWLAS